MKTRLSQDLHQDMELLKKMFPKMLNMKNANKVQKKKFFQNSTKDIMTYSNNSVIVKRRRDDNNQRKWTFV